MRQPTIRRTTQQREAERRARDEEFWAQKRQQASTPRELAAVAWDRLRQSVGRLPADTQPGEWQRVEMLLEQIRTGLKPHAA